MTERSKRRRAEMAVIDAAVAYYQASFPRSRQHDKLCDAVKEYQRLGLAQLSERGTTSNNSTDTSNQAAASLGDVSGDARRCFDEIVLAGGLTVYQLTQVLGRSHQTISARVNDLMNKGWIVDSGLRRPTGSGRKAIVWKPSEAALRKLP